MQSVTIVVVAKGSCNAKAKLMFTRHEGQLQERTVEYILQLEVDPK